MSISIKFTLKSFESFASYFIKLTFTQPEEVVIALRTEQVLRHFLLQAQSLLWVALRSYSAGLLPWCYLLWLSWFVEALRVGYLKLWLIILYYSLLISRWHGLPHGAFPTAARILFFNLLDARYIFLLFVGLASISLVELLCCEIISEKQLS